MDIGLDKVDLVCTWIAELVPFFAALFSFVYGLKHFFKKGKPLFLQSITMAMGCHALSTLYHICQSLTTETVFEGFTPAYLGRIGFFLFLIAASYGHMDRIVDDGSEIMKKSRIIAFIAPLLAALMYVPNATIDEIPVSTLTAIALVWIPAMIAVYFNLKHALIPDCDFGFIKALKPYNVLATLLGFAELLCLTAWDYFYNTQLVIASIIFAILCVSMIVVAKKGAEKWTI